MWFGVICVKPRNQLCTATFATNICVKTVRENISKLNKKKHKVVPFKDRMIRPKCRMHSFEQCELHCEPCDIPLCFHCVSSGEHDQHKKVDVLIHFENKKKKKRLANKRTTPRNVNLNYRSREKIKLRCSRSCCSYCGCFFSGTTDS